MQEFFAVNDLSNEVVAAGVSGGADSLALVLRLKKYCKKVVALTVDHGLRPSSRQEAQYVAELMRKAGIEHHILIWEGEKPSSDIEAIARDARYGLLCDWCHKNEIKYLAVGHHLRDQAETFLLRLQRGSGLSGLCAMLPITQRGGISIIRPQLYDNPDDLRQYLKQENIKWVEDESNYCDDFMRVKIRNFLPDLAAKIGLSELRLAETAKVLQRTRTYFEYEVEKRIKNQVRKIGDKIFAFSKATVAECHEEIAYRLLENLLRQCSEKTYAPEADEILRLLRVLLQDDFRGCTLNGCEIVVARNRIWLIPEVKKQQVLTKAEWDRCLQFVPSYAKANLPYKVRRALYNQFMRNENGQEN